MYERSGGSKSVEERLANRGATTHVVCHVWANYPLNPDLHEYIRFDPAAIFVTLTVGTLSEIT